MNNNVYTILINLGGRSVVLIYYRFFLYISCMKRFIGFLMMVLFIGAFTGFGNTIADLTENSEKVITVSADDVITADVVILKMVKRNILHERVNVSSTNSFNNKSSKTNDVHNYVSNYSLYQNKKPYNCARDKLSCN